MKEWMDDVPVTYGAGSWPPDAQLKADVRRSIAGLDVRSVDAGGTVTFRMERDVEVVYMGADGLTDGPSLDQVLAQHARQIATNHARNGRTHVIDANDAHVAMANGGLDMLRQLARTATPAMRIHVWRSGECTVAPGQRELAAVTGVRIRLQNGRISSHVHRDAQTWAHGSLLVGRGLLLPASLVGAIPGRRLDDVAAGTFLEGRGLTVRKAWNVGGSLGMTFEPRVVDIHEALRGQGSRRIAA